MDKDFGYERGPSTYTSPVTSLVRSAQAFVQYGSVNSKMGGGGPEERLVTFGVILIAGGFGKSWAGWFHDRRLQVEQR